MRKLVALGAVIVICLLVACGATKASQEKLDLMMEKYDDMYALQSETVRAMEEYEELANSVGDYQEILDTIWESISYQTVSVTEIGGAIEEEYGNLTEAEVDEMLVLIDTLTVEIEDGLAGIQASLARLKSMAEMN